MRKWQSLFWTQVGTLRIPMRGYELALKCMALLFDGSYESPCGVMRRYCTVAAVVAVTLRIPMRGYELRAL